MLFEAAVVPVEAVTEGVVFQDQLKFAVLFVPTWPAKIMFGLFVNVLINEPFVLPHMAVLSAYAP